MIHFSASLPKVLMTLIIFIFKTMWVYATHNYSHNIQQLNRSCNLVLTLKRQVRLIDYLINGYKLSKVFF